MKLRSFGIRVCLGVAAIAGRPIAVRFTDD